MCAKWLRWVTIRAVRNDYARNWGRTIPWYVGPMQPLPHSREFANFANIPNRRQTMPVYKPSTQHSESELSLEIESSPMEQTFGDPRGWKESKKGNLWRWWCGVKVAVFKNKTTGLYSWCILGSRKTRYSDSDFETEDRAISSLYDAVSNFLTARAKMNRSVSE